MTVHVTKDQDDRIIATPVPLVISGAITTLSKASGYIEIDEKQLFVDTGEKVKVHLFRPTP